jgi:hypothetical protein
MKFKIYLRVIGPETAIRSFDSDAALPQSRISSLRRQAVWPPTPGTDVSWQWQTEFVEAQTDTVEKAVMQFVAASKPLARHITKHRAALNWASLVIVGECTESEVPGGLYFSAETISAVRDLGVDLDIDFSRVSEEVTP